MSAALIQVACYVFCQKAGDTGGDVLSVTLSVQHNNALSLILTFLYLLPPCHLIGLTCFN